ncbi:hypothetical protein STCU_12267 [Strigomonas culicis]|uniref:Secreted protein n=1 Tax=Strigomonas culicis TaxID=28005 RepID=S9TFT6_9TRYP|nr:hypothetical protein STCU_12267 [Strigomonas culicis]|eukprot:EPY15193.1 hypothetical protein STCU_12267 [Strigomonas culicis]
MSFASSFCWPHTCACGAWHLPSIAGVLFSPLSLFLQLQHANSSAVCVSTGLRQSEANDLAVRCRVEQWRAARLKDRHSTAPNYPP